MPPLSREEREQFLTEPHIGALAVEAGADRGPLVIPVWYDYEPGGELWIVTEADSRKARLISEAGRFSLMAERLEPSVRYVSVEGPVSEIRPATEAEDTAMAERYLGEEGAAEYLKTRGPQFGELVTVRMRPKRWNSSDLGSI
ncbi:pyridoxamine 5'-phosphate oxidase family protein [Streptomyces durbertensis]|uniref:Pyridoxamine 5'-phosphate oxidase family protein n=1 Tax=Streptomyces durbertensis TaxID=2448886 RepID=A0ABR6EN19_9ACTN|nr:pyridoxamine 5'-phosphate oxidase family protein [Streptomyces durbertensis]MBB1246740.1 pyridoxamine 5'-phosphate oxidase family protein [Streptomyces durbertensis]